MRHPLLSLLSCTTGAGASWLSVPAGTFRQRASRVDCSEGLELRRPAMREWEVREMPTYNYRFDYFEDLLEGMAKCRAHNAEVVPLLRQLQTKDFFACFPVDLMAPCSYMPTEETPCELGKCDIEPMDESPDNLAARDYDEYEFVLDGWARWDQPSDFTEYYDLRENPEINTEYDGRLVWRFIHQKICFLNELDTPESGWKRDWNRMISGMHALVDCQILADIGTSEYGLVEYRRRLRDEPGAIENLYFAYMLSLCALRECRERLCNCNYLGEGEEIRPIMQELLDSPLVNCGPVLRAAQSSREHASQADAMVWKMRLRSRDVLRIMNCVQCNLCRLHGKVTSMGLASALQMLLGQDGEGDEPLSLTRVQLAALGAVAAKLGVACQTAERFREADEASGGADEVGGGADEASDVVSWYDSGERLAV